MKINNPQPSVSIVQRGAASFRVRTRWRDPETGEWREVNETVRGTRAVAEAHRRQIVDRFATGQITQLSAESVGRYVDDWITYRLAMGDIKETTADTYRVMLKNFTDLYGETRLVSVRPELVREWLMQTVASKGAATARYTANILKHAFAEAVRSGIMLNNPFDKLTLPKREDTHKTVTLDPKQVRAVVTMEESDRTFFARLLLETGLRRGELAALQWRDISETGIISVSKTAVLVGKSKVKVWTPKTKRSVRKIAVRPAMRDELNVRRGEPDVYVCNGLAVPPNPRHVSGAVERAMRAAGVKNFTAHDLRHAHATHLLRNRLPPAAVSQRLGHSKTSITLDVYSHALQDDQADILESVDRFLGT